SGRSSCQPSARGRVLAADSSRLPSAEKLRAYTVPGCSLSVRSVLPPGSSTRSMPCPPRPSAARVPSRDTATHSTKAWVSTRGPPVRREDGPHELVAGPVERADHPAGRGVGQVDGGVGRVPVVPGPQGDQGVVGGGEGDELPDVVAAGVLHLPSGGPGGDVGDGEHLVLGVPDRLPVGGHGELLP